MPPPSHPLPRRALRAALLGALAATGAPSHAAPPAPPPAPPLAATGWRQLPDSAAVDAFLAGVAARSDCTRLVRTGTSAGGRPLHALLVSASPAFLAGGETPLGQLAVMLVGSQHGTEPAGAEALQQAAHELVDGRLRRHLAHMSFVLVPNGNPDGRDAHRRVNAAGVNLSTDFTVLSQPETRALLACLQRYRPHALLDLHESALLKKRSLGAQGWLTDFEAQFEVPNNPNVHPALLALGRDVLLPQLVTGVNARGLPCRHYLGEITAIDQPLTHGGLAVRNLRNYAALRGTLAVLAENRLDPPGDWPTLRNLKARTAKQLLCLEAFLDACAAARPRLAAACAAARRTAWAEAPAPALALAPAYAPDPARPRITVPLRRRDSGELVPREFVYQPTVVRGPHLLEPATLFVTAHHDLFAGLLARHAIPFERVAAAATRPCVRQRIDKVTRVTGRTGFTTTTIDLSEAPAEAALRPGDLRIDPARPGSLLAPLLLDPRSPGGVFQDPAFQATLTEGGDFFIVRSRPAGD